jgi:hypothetical protein
MKLNDLKRLTYETWEFMHRMQDAIAVSEFQAEVRRCGDRRCKATWEKAYAQFQAIVMDNRATESRFMLQWFFVRPEDPEIIEYNDLLLETYLQLPDAIERIKIGLEDLYWQPTESEDQADAIAFIKRLSGLPQLPGREKMLQNLLPAA